jgi:hypothetical protein
MQNGFLNCQPLRDEPANAALLNRPLKQGDIVTVPDIRPQIVNRPVDAAHPFVKKNSPPVSIRFVHGSPDKHYLEDTETMVLNVSNFRTDKGGVNAQAPFPDQFEFHQEGHVDPDTFKVEVVDPGVGGGPITVALDPRMPVYSLVNGKLVVTDHTIFRDSTEQFPSLAVECALVRSGVAFRSKYLRLVTNSGDLKSKIAQTLSIGTIADGKGTGAAGDPDNVEILDFDIRAAYVIVRCPGSPKCSVEVTRPVGDESEQLRFRIAFHIFKRRGTGAPMDGLTAQKVRHAALRELRKFHAQSSMAPKLVSADGSVGGPAVVFMDEPDDNMIVIGESSGRGASGRNRSGQTSTLTIFDGLLGTIATVTLSRMTPLAVGNAINDALDSSIFTAQVFENEAPNTAAPNGSCDVLITRQDGAAITLGVLTDDTVLRNNITVARVSVDIVDRNSDAQVRRVIRSSPGPEGVINVYPVGTVLDGSLAFSLPFLADFPAKMHGRPPIVNSVLCGTPFLDETNISPSPDVLSHECGHILGDVGHVPRSDPHFRTELMSGSGNPSVSVSGAKRISDTPILVHYELLDPAGSVALINAVKRFRTRSPNLVEPW